MRNIGLGLIVIVIGDEILDGVVGKESLELTIELRREGLVGRDDERGPLHPVYHVGHRKGFARSGNPEQCLLADAVEQAGGEFLDCLGLVPGRFHVALQ